MSRRQRQHGCGAGRRVGVGGGSAALEDGKEAQARHWRAGSRPQSGSGGRRRGSQPKRCIYRFLKRHNCCMYALCSIAEQKQLSVVSERRAL